ncbi:MAG: hypothetical protein HOI47_31295 [Candidatus Scalindua sp.]|jgi:hypothetical protein|nr:hypothetical protein [Candidatus Scalindua sp.]
MDDIIPLKVYGTTNDDRNKVPYDFVVVLKPSLASSLGLNKYVVISRVVNDTDNQAAEKKKCPLRVYGVLIEDDKLDIGEIRMDQTLRNALGIPFEAGEHVRSDLAISPLKLTIRQRLLTVITSWLGRRYLFLRVAKLYPPDIEKNICRVPVDALSLMGTAEGNKVVLVGCVKPTKERPMYKLQNCSVKAFDINLEMSNRRSEEEEKQFEKRWAARYVNSGKLLSVEPDIGRIMLDSHVRKMLNVQPGDPIKVRRNFPDLFKHQLMEAGILLSISAIALTPLMPEYFKTSNYVWYVVASLSVSVGFAVLVIVLRLRARVQ